MQDNTYGPWVVVTQRKSGARNHRTRKKGPHGQENEQMRQPRRSGKRDHWVNKGPVSVNLNAGPSRETKRELFPPKFMAGAQIASRIKGIGRALIMP